MTTKCPCICQGHRRKDTITKGVGESSYLRDYFQTAGSVKENQEEMTWCTVPAQPSWKARHALGLIEQPPQRNARAHCGNQGACLIRLLPQISYPGHTWPSQKPEVKGHSNSPKWQPLRPRNQEETGGSGRINREFLENPWDIWLGFS